MSEHETLQSLQAEHDSVQAEISASMKSGTPTLGARRRLSELQAKIAAARESAPAVHPAVAVARQRLDEVEAEYHSASAAVNELSGKIAAMRTRHDELVQTRITTGDVSGDAEIYALSASMTAVSATLTEAQAHAANLAPGINLARVELRTAEATATRAENRIKAEATAERCRQLDAELCAALADCAAFGSRAGVSLPALVKASSDLVRWIQTGAIPMQLAARG